LPATNGRTASSFLIMMLAAGEVVFRHACKFGLEGIVSKRRDSACRSGRSKAWVKVKNPESPAMRRLEVGSWRL
jgi:ATP-dependent DNA ligase